MGFEYEIEGRAIELADLIRSLDRTGYRVERDQSDEGDPDES